MDVKGSCNNRCQKPIFIFQSIGSMSGCVLYVWVCQMSIIIIASVTGIYGSLFPPQNEK